MTAAATPDAPGVGATEPAAAPAAGAAGVYLVPFDGTEVSTVFSSSFGLEYTITVSGVGLYENTTGLLDCDYASRAGPSDVLSPWADTIPGFTIDGVDEPCGAYNHAHVYTLTEDGSGMPLTFQYDDDGQFGNETGYLVVTVTPPI